MTPLNFQRRSNGYYKKYEMQMAGIRLIIFNMIAGNPNIKEGAKPKSPEDIFRLSIDPKPILVTEEKRDSDLELVEKFKQSKIANK